jgi:hypothetical protein
MDSSLVLGSRGPGGGYYPPPRLWGSFSSPSKTAVSAPRAAVSAPITADKNLNSWNDWLKEQLSVQLMQENFGSISTTVQDFTRNSLCPTTINREPISSRQSSLQTDFVIYFQAIKLILEREQASEISFIPFLTLFLAGLNNQKAVPYLAGKLYQPLVQQHNFNVMMSKPPAYIKYGINKNQKIDVFPKSNIEVAKKQNGNVMIWITVDSELCYTQEVLRGHDSIIEKKEKIPNMDSTIIYNLEIDPRTLEVIYNEAYFFVSHGSCLKLFFQENSFPEDYKTDAHASGSVSPPIMGGFLRNLLNELDVGSVHQVNVVNAMAHWPVIAF